MKNIFCALILICTVFSARAQPRTANATEKLTVVPVVHLANDINLGVSEYILRALREAQAQAAPALLIELDTPGGFLEATREIVQAFLNTNNLKIIVWVSPEGARAASAGSMITMAAHFAAMAPSTSIGAATPINGTGSDIGKDLKAKIENDTLSFVSGIAEKRGRNVEWARQSVSLAASLTSSEAFRKNVIDGVFSTREELWSGVRKKFSELPEHVTFVPLEKTAKESFLNFISNPNIAYGLMTVGALGLYMEISHPGVIVPGAVGALALALGAITTKIIPIRPGAILLLILGLVLFAVELLTPFPTYGISGIGGAICLFLSGLFLLDSARSDLHLNAAIWLPIFVAVVGFMIFLGTAALKALKRQDYRQGFSALIGAEAEVITVLSPNEAKVQFRGELWTAQWQRDYSTHSPPAVAFFKGQKVKVVGKKGFVVFVIEAKT